MNYEIEQSLGRIHFFKDQLAKERQIIKDLRLQCVHRFKDTGAMFFDEYICEECGVRRTDDSIVY